MFSAFPRSGDVHLGVSYLFPAYQPATPDPSADARPEMLASSTPIDVVFVLTVDQYHAEHIILAANAGKHVMIEKPMAQTLAEADAIEEARVKNGVVVFVGYMRRYATALEMLKEAIKGKTIKCELGLWAGVGGPLMVDVRVRDIIGNVSARCSTDTFCDTFTPTSC